MEFSQSASAGDGLTPPRLTPSTDGELVRCFLDGSADAATEIVRLHGPRIFNFLFQFTRHRQDAEDITQETFVKAFKSLHRFDTDRPLVNWLLTIARRTALNHFRSARNWNTIPEETASADPQPDTTAEQNDAVENIWDTARKNLSQREFEILWLRFGENLSIQETARVAGLTQTHVKVLVYRARRHLMKGQSQP